MTRPQQPQAPSSTQRRALFPESIIAPQRPQNEAEDRSYLESLGVEIFSAQSVTEGGVRTTIPNEGAISIPVGRIEGHDENRGTVKVRFFPKDKAPVLLALPKRALKGYEHSDGSISLLVQQEIAERIYNHERFGDVPSVSFNYRYTNPARERVAQAAIAASAGFAGAAARATDYLAGRPAPSIASSESVAGSARASASTFLDGGVRGSNTLQRRFSDSLMQRSLRGSASHGRQVYVPSPSGPELTFNSVAGDFEAALTTLRRDGNCNTCEQLITMANKALVDPNALNDPFMRLNLAGSMFGEMLEVLFGPGEEPIMPPFSDFSGLLGNYGPQFMSLINHNSLEIIFKNEIIDLFRNSTLEGILPTQSSWGKSVDEVVSVIDSALVNPGASQPVPAYRPAPAPVPAPWAQPALQPVPASMPAPQPAPNSRPSPLPVGFRPFVVPEVGPHEMPAPLMVPALPPAIPGFTVHPIALPVPGGQAIVPAWLALPNGVDPYQPALVLSQPQIGVVLIPEVSPVPAPGMRAPEPAFRPVPYELEPGMAPGDVIVPVLQAPRSAFIPAPTPESRNASVPAIPASEILGAVNESQQEANIGLIAGLSIAGAAVLAALGALAVYYKKRPRRAASTEPAGTEMRQVVTEGVATPVPAADDLQPGAQGERANLDDVAVVVQGAAPGRAPSPTASEPARFPSGSTRGNEV